MTSSKKIKKSLSLIIIVITAYTFINQFYLTENNKLLADKLNHLERNTLSVVSKNLELEKIVENKKTSLKHMSDKIVSDSTLPINTSILRNLQSQTAQAYNSKDEIAVDSKIASIEEKSNTSIKQSIQSIEKVVQKPLSKIVKDKNLQNILIYGVNAGLTDTLLVISINNKIKKISLISIPRDYWDSIYKAKINRVYRKYGYEAFIDSVERVLGIKIHKNIRVDFKSFTNIVDHLNGIWIYNNKDILDKRYPSNDYKYETFELATGYHNLDGATALKFARTRHGDSDFQRAKRQQEVINGVYNALLKLDYKDINKILNIVRELIVYVKTDISIFEGLQMLSDYKNYRLNFGNVINNPKHLYSDRNYNGEYILLPRDPSMTQIHNFVQDTIKK